MLPGTISNLARVRFPPSGTAPGNVDGPTSSTDNAIVRFDGTTGKLIQNSAVTIADTTGAMTWASGQDAVLTGGNAGVLTLAAATTLLGGAGNMTITAGTGNSRTLTLQTTTSGGTATTGLSINATQDTTLSGNLTLGASASSITGAAGNMTILSGTGASRTMIFQTTTSGSAATTALTLNADQSATFAGKVRATPGSAASPGFILNAGSANSGMYYFGTDGVGLAANGAAALTITSAGVANVSAATATPAAGSVAARLIFGTTATFGIYYGSGNPTVTAAQGSIYLKSDGSGIADRLWVNTTGSTTWTNFVSAA